MFARIFSPLIQSLAFASATIFLGVAFVVQGQEAAPPGANALPPINVGEGGQVKEGGLSLGSLIVKGGSVFEGNVGINMASNIELAVRGKVGAEQFCDTEGNNCIEIANLVSGNGLWSSPGNDKIYYNKGNVGIGTNNPLSTLDVDGRITATDLRLLGFLLFDDNTGGDYIAHTSQDGLSYYENGEEQWRLAGMGNSYINGGKVGIGTTNPATRLSVEGDISANRFCDKNGRNCVAITDVGGGGSNNLSDYNNDVGFITDGNTNWNNIYGFITSADIGNGFVKSTGDTMTGNLIMSGASIGINKTPSGAQLHVYDTSESSIKIEGGTGSANASLRLDNRDQAWTIQNAGWLGDDLLFYDITSNKAAVRITNGTTNNMTVNGSVNANQFCDKNGNYCRSLSDGWVYISPQKSHPGDGGAVFVYHNLPKAPNEIEVDAINISSDGGFNAGDRIYNLPSLSQTSDRLHHMGIVIAALGSNQIAFRVSSGGIWMVQKSNGNPFRLDPAKWRFIIKAR